MPINMRLAINLYLLEDTDGWYILDTGLPTGITRQYWHTIFSEEMSDKPVKGVIVTHMHSDHIGNAAWLIEKFKVPLFMSEGEYIHFTSLIHRVNQPPNWHERQYYLSAGILEKDVDDMINLRKNPNLTAPALFQRLLEDEKIIINNNSWQVIIGKGHSPEHVCLYSQELGILISGDHILPKISPNISVWPFEPLQNPLKEYLNTLQKFVSLPDDTLVLPSHNLPFKGLKLRIQELEMHHQEIIKTIQKFCEEEQPAIAVLRKLYNKELDGFNFVFALCESHAHLNYMCASGQLIKRLDDNNILQYRTC